MALRTAFVSRIGRWTDNVFALRPWCRNKFNIEENQFNKQFDVPDDFDYIDSWDDKTLPLSYDDPSRLCICLGCYFFLRSYVLFHCWSRSWNWLSITLWSIPSSFYRYCPRVFRGPVLSLLSSFQLLHFITSLLRSFFKMAQMITNGLVKEMLRPGMGYPVRQGDTVTVECTGWVW